MAEQGEVAGPDRRDRADEIDTPREAAGLAQTERNATELSLAELAAGPFVPIAEAMPAMLWLGDPEGRCIYLNRALREFWGVKAGDLPHFSWTSRLVPEDQAALSAVFDDAMANKRAFSVKARLRRADGAVRRLLTKAEPRFAPNGAFLGMVGINIDISDEA